MHPVFVNPFAPVLGIAPAAIASMSQPQGRTRATPAGGPVPLVPVAGFAHLLTGMQANATRTAGAAEALPARRRT